jgi:hypothetical protein
MNAPDQCQFRRFGLRSTGLEIRGSFEKHHFEKPRGKQEMLWNLA